MPSVKVRIHCPNISSLPNESAYDRAIRLAREIENAYKAQAEIFIAPEYYFTHNTSSLPQAFRTCIAYDDDEMETARAIISRASEAAPKMLIVMGSMFMIQGQANPHIFNTAFVYLGGSKVTECSKFDRAADADYATKCGYNFFPGETGTAFEFKGIRCYLQICTDTTNAPTVESDLSIVVSYKPGAAALAGSKNFAARILSNGEGQWLIRDGEEKVVKTGKGPNHDATVTWPDTTSSSASASSSASSASSSASNSGSSASSASSSASTASAEKKDEKKEPAQKNG